MTLSAPDILDAGSKISYHMGMMEAPLGNVQKISVALTPELVAMVNSAVDAGEFASASEVIRDALRGWNGRRAERAEAMEEVRRAWHEGLASGPAVDADIVMTRLQARLAESSQRRRAQAD